MTVPVQEQHPDPHLAYWLEMSEALALQDAYTAASAVPGNPTGAAAVAIGGGVACGLTVIDFVLFNRVIGLGTARPATEADAEAASRFFLDLGVTESVVQVAPGAQPRELVSWLEARGYGRGRRWAKLWQPLDQVPARSSLRIERIGADRAEPWAEVCLTAFEMPPQVGDALTASIGRPGWTHYLGFDGADGLPAGLRTPELGATSSSGPVMGYGRTMVRRVWRTRLLPMMLGLGVVTACTAPDAERGDLLTPVPEASGATTAAPASLPVPDALDRDLEDSDEWRQEREALVSLAIDPAVEDQRVIDAMRAVPRHAFVPTAVLDDAYQDFPQPIEHGQTISQPSLVARMTELLELEPGDRVLEVGTGSGYQAAILAELTDDVFSVEIIPQLAGTARAVLDRLGYDEVRVERRDGYLGWPENAPYDAIIVTAAPDHLPQPLVEQMRPDGGRMVIPIGPVGDVQTLWLVTREDGEARMQRILDVRFVPLVREEGSTTQAATAEAGPIDRRGARTTARR